jgi:hypothetical protein
MDHRDRSGNRCRDSDSVAWLNAGVLLICLIGYLAFGAGSGILRFHGRDFLATPALLAIANLLTLKSPFPNLFVKPRWAALVVAAAAFHWEVISPLYLQQSTPDFLDVVAYAIGGLTYVGVCRKVGVRARKATCQRAAPPESKVGIRWITDLSHTRASPSLL